MLESCLHNRKYCPTCIKYRFIAIEHGEESLPQCVVCMKTQPSLLKCHLVTNHSKGKEQYENNFQQLGENVKRQHLDKTGAICHKKKVVKALHKVALLVAKNIKTCHHWQVFANASSKDFG